MQPCNSSTLKKRKADDLTIMLQQEDTSEESAMPSSYRSLFKFLRYQTPEINAAVSESGLWLWRRSARDGCEGHTAKGKKRSCVRPTQTVLCRSAALAVASVDFKLTFDGVDDLAVLARISRQRI